MTPDELGEIVRRAWVRWARKQDNPKASWLVSWDEQEKFVNSWWQTPDLFRSDYPVRRYMERIQELEKENKKLKGEAVEDDGIF